MRVLLRSCPNGDQYVWKKAEMKDARTFALEDGTCAYQAGIVSISRDNRKKFVKCSSCGALIRNTPEAIKVHTDRASTSASCFGCQYMREGDGKQLSAKYTLQDRPYFQALFVSMLFENQDHPHSFLIAANLLNF